MNAGDLSRAERKNLRAVYQGYYPTPGLMAFLWSDAMRRMTSGVLWAVMQVLITAECCRMYQDRSPIMTASTTMGLRSCKRCNAIFCFCRSLFSVSAAPQLGFGNHGACTMHRSLCWEASPADSP